MMCYKLLFRGSPAIRMRSPSYQWEGHQLGERGKRKRGGGKKREGMVLPKFCSRPSFFPLGEEKKKKGGKKKKDLSL